MYKISGRDKIITIVKWIFLTEIVFIFLRISFKFIPKIRINNIPVLVLIMAWRRPGVKPLSEPMVVSLLTHICVTRPQWVNVNTTNTIQYKNQAALQEVNYVTLHACTALVLEIDGLVLCWYDGVWPTLFIWYQHTYLLHYRLKIRFSHKSIAPVLLIHKNNDDVTVRKWNSN